MQKLLSVYANEVCINKIISKSKFPCKLSRCSFVFAFTINSLSLLWISFTISQLQGLGKLAHSTRFGSCVTRKLSGDAVSVHE